MLQTLDSLEMLFSDPDDSKLAFLHGVLKQLNCFAKVACDPVSTYKVHQSYGVNNKYAILVMVAKLVALETCEVAEYVDLYQWCWHHLKIYHKLGKSFNCYTYMDLQFALEGNDLEPIGCVGKVTLHSHICGTVRDLVADLSSCKMDSY